MDALIFRIGYLSVETRESYWNVSEGKKKWSWEKGQSVSLDNDVLALGSTYVRAYTHTRSQVHAHSAHTCTYDALGP